MCAISNNNNWLNWYSAFLGTHRRFTVKGGTSLTTISDVCSTYLGDARQPICARTLNTHLLAVLCLFPPFLLTRLVLLTLPKPQSQHILLTQPQPPLSFMTHLFPSAPSYGPKLCGFIKGIFPLLLPEKGWPSADGFASYHGHTWANKKQQLQRTNCKQTHRGLQWSP